MDAEHRDEESIFKAAIKITSSTERKAYLKRACGNDLDLLVRVEALLKAYDEAGNFLESPPDVENTLDAGPLSEGPGTVIGRYKLLEQIGEGGFGVVYMAEQTKPISRRVALKIIKLGMDTKQVIARFEAERQALAMMDHPNITKVFDAGATETGRPYFVMELVKGMPITEYCDKNNLDTRQRLDLFIAACKAVQHAHQKGIVHRDIKPSNVLITLHDGKPVPKIIDFGIAKATQHRLTEKTLFTEYRQLIGTPEYMSPEQAEMSGLDVDTRTDIYSLGVLLYELLTGTTPFDAEKLRSAAFDEMCKIIRETEPPKPSTRLSALGDLLGDVAKHRQVQPDQLYKIIRGDLDWVVMKTLEKDRTRRYETANELAGDIQRHLADEPVSAGPPGVGYCVRKFVRRNRTLVMASMVIAVALVVGLGISTLMYFRAEHARKEEAIARSLAEAARQNEATARQEAEKAESVALARLANNYEDFGRQALLKQSFSKAFVYLNAAFQLDPKPTKRRFLLASAARRFNAETAFRCHGKITSALFTSDGEYLVALTENEWLVVTDLKKGKTVPLSRVKKFNLSPCEKYLWYLTRDMQMIWVYDIGRNERALRTPVCAWLDSTPLAFSPHSSQIAILGPDSRWALYDTRNWRLTGYLEAASLGDQQMMGLGSGFQFELRVLHDEHTSLGPFCPQVQPVQFSPNGKQIVTIGARDGRAKLWDSNSRQLLGSLGDDGRCVNAAYFGPAGDRLYTLSVEDIYKGKSALPRRREEMEEVKKENNTDNIPTPPEPNLPFRPPTEWSDSLDWKLTIWELDTKKKVAEMRPEFGTLREFFLSPDGYHIVGLIARKKEQNVFQIEGQNYHFSHPESCWLAIWDAQTGRKWAEVDTSLVVENRDWFRRRTSAFDPINTDMRKRWGNVFEPLMAPSGDFFVLFWGFNLGPSYKPLLRVYAIPDGRLVTKGKGTCSFSAKSPCFAFFNHENRPELWTAERVGIREKPFPLYTLSTVCVADGSYPPSLKFSNNSHRLAVFYPNEQNARFSAEIWEFPTEPFKGHKPRLLSRLEFPQAESLWIDPTLSRFLRVDKHGMAAVAESIKQSGQRSYKEIPGQIRASGGGGEFIRSYRVHDPWIGYDWQYAFTELDSKTFALRRTDTWEVIQRFDYSGLPAQLRRFIEPEISANGKFIITKHNWPRDLVLWEVKNGTSIGILQDCQKAFMSKDRTRLIVFKSQAQGEVWDVNTGKHLHDFTLAECMYVGRSSNPLDYLDSGPPIVDSTGERVVGLTTARFLSIWELSTGRKQVVCDPNLRDYSGEAGFLIGDSQVFAMNREKNKTYMFDVATGNKLFSTDGRLVATNADASRLLMLSQFVQIVDGSTGTLIATLEQKPKAITDVTFARQNALLLIAEKKHVSIWDTETGRLLDRFNVFDTILRLKTADGGDTLHILGLNEDHYRLTISKWDISLENRSPSEMNHWVKRHVPLRLEEDAIIAVQPNLDEKTNN